MRIQDPGFSFCLATHGSSFCALCISKPDPVTQKPDKRLFNLEAMDLNAETLEFVMQLWVVCVKCQDLLKVVGGNVANGCTV